MSNFTTPPPRKKKHKLNVLQIKLCCELQNKKKYVFKIVSAIQNSLRIYGSVFQMFTLNEYTAVLVICL